MTLENIKCNNCIWYDQCEEIQIKKCNDYSPTDDIDDEIIYKMIEENRVEFRREWFRYIKINGGDK